MTRIACVKCGNDNFSVVWCGYDCWYDTPIGGIANDDIRVNGEHMMHSCRTCGWSYATRPLDHQDAGSGK